MEVISRVLVVPRHVHLGRKCRQLVNELEMECLTQRNSAYVQKTQRTEGAVEWVY